MKDIFRIIVILSIILTACDGIEPESAPDDLTDITQPILYGTLDKDEPYVISLFLPNQYEIKPTMCNEKNIAECRKTLGDDATCIYSNGEHICVPYCPEGGVTPEQVCVDAESISYTLTRQCLNIDETSVFAEDYSTTVFCNHGCDDNGTSCDSEGESIYTLCDSGNISLCKQYYGRSYTCVQERFDDVWCAQTCTEEGLETQKCERGDNGYTTSIRTCTKISNTLVDITHKSYACDGACNSDGTDCIKKAKPSKPVVQSLGSSYCTGTLIHPEWILTAAHCVTDDETGEILPMDYNEMAQIGFGYLETSLKLYNTKGPDYFFFHPDYNGSSEDYIHSDIALIKLKKPVPASVAEPVLPLPPWLAFSSEDLPIVMDTSGFGYDEYGNSGTKRTIALPTTHYCGMYNPDDPKDGICSVGKVTINGCHPDPMYCAFYGNYNTTYQESIPYGTIFAPINEGGQCNGDSGGPTFYTVGDKRYVVGITSYGDAACRGYNVATSVQDFYDWILEIAPEVAEQYKEVCGNGIDDDNNGLIDDDDPGCEYCGDHKLNANEMCEDTSFVENKTTCAQWDDKYISGDVTCNDDCTINFDACTEAHCGDDIVNRDEVCDGSHFKEDESSCHILFPDLYSDGEVACTDTCNYDTASCIPYCGNGTIDAGEACDHGTSGDVFPSDAATCEQFIGKGAQGTLTCSDDCQQIRSTNCSAVPQCGNDQLDDGEDCDGNQFANNQILCSQWNSQYIAGSVQCSSQCTIDFSNCQAATVQTIEICGNQIDDDNNGLVDCDDPTCANLVACQPIIVPQPTPPEPPAAEVTETKKSSDSDCSSMPLSGNMPPIGMLLLGLLGIGMMRRRNN